MQISELIYSQQFIPVAGGIWGLFINFLSGMIFAYDKKAAIKGRHRIPEKTLHILEILGGVFANILLMYILRHKNRKFSYWIWTWLALIGWLALLMICLR
jgi:uncharacterized membrane protein YsdA (DUF1294 family)